jgi:hypothetical protein
MIDTQVKYLDSAVQEVMAKSDDNPICIKLIKEWIDLARTHKKRKGQIDLLLHDLSDLPQA